MQPRSKLHLQWQLFLLFSAIIILPLSLCSFFLYRQSAAVIEKNIGSTYITRLDFFADRFRLVIARFYQDMLNVAVDRNIKKMVLSPMSITDSDYSENYEYLNRITRNIQITDNIVHGIIVYSKYRNWLFVNNANASNLYTGDLEKLAWVQTALNQERYNRLKITSSVSTVYKSDGNRVISLYITMQDINSPEAYGYISINLDIAAIQSQLEQEFLRDNPRNILIVDGQGNIISDYGPPVTMETISLLSERTGKSINPGYYTGKIGGEKMFISHSYIPSYEWQVFVLTPYRQINNQVGMVTNIVTIIFIIFLLLSIGIAYIVSVNLLNPLRILFQAMREVKEGKIGSTIPYHRDDEIGLLYDGFNEMSKNLGTMMERLYQDELAKKDLQLKIMSYQINAHFLYNTLDAIHWIASINKIPKISNLVSALVSYFRITLSEGQDIISIGQVVQLAENYMNIYTIKSDFKVDIHIDIAESLYEYKTLKYIFQPLLENALNHGIEKKAADGAIRFACRLSEGDLYFTITDTGAGIAPEKLAELQDTLQKSELNAIGSFALRNINLQIKIYYGNQYGMKIDSVLGEGTTVLVRVPVLPV